MECIQCNKNMIEKSEGLELILEFIEKVIKTHPEIIYEFNQDTCETFQIVVWDNSLACDTIKE